LLRIDINKHDKMPSSTPPFPLRLRLENQSKRFVWMALAASVATSVAWYVFYTEPRRRNYVKFFETYDPYVRLREICAYDIAGRRYMTTCPTELAKLAQEKGYEIAELESPPTSQKRSSKAAGES